MQTRLMLESEIEDVRSLINANFKMKIDIDTLRHTLTCEQCKTYVTINDQGKLAAAGLMVEDGRVCWVCSGDKRQGCARALMGCLIKANPNLYLYVKQVNFKAINLYESLGFSVTGTKDHSFRMELKPKR